MKYISFEKYEKYIFIGARYTYLLVQVVVEAYSRNVYKYIQYMVWVQNYILLV